MKIVIESTSRIVEVCPSPDAKPVTARVWQGTTESGIPIVVLITRIGVHRGEDQRQFEEELTEVAAPNAAAVDVYPARLIL